MTPAKERERQYAGRKLQPGATHYDLEVLGGHFDVPGTVRQLDLVHGVRVPVAGRRVLDDDLVARHHRRLVF